VGRVRVRVLLLLRVYECEYWGRPASMNKSELRLRQLRRSGALRALNIIPQHADGPAGATCPAEGGRLS